MPGKWHDITGTLQTVMNATRAAFPGAAVVHASALDTHTTAVLSTASAKER